MKKQSAVFIVIPVLLYLAARFAKKKSKVKGIIETDDRFVVTFENATKDMAVSTEMVLGENQHFSYDHQLSADDSILLQYRKAADVSDAELELSGCGKGQSHLDPNKYMVAVTVLGKADGTLTLRVEDDQKVGIANPWKMTADMDEALAATGISFHSPIEETMPGNMKYEACFYTEDTFQANYADEPDKMIFRVSKVHEGKKDLAGDYNEYEKTWHESVRGLDVTCYGKEDSIHLATFTYGQQNYSISYNLYQDLPGMTADELRSLLNGM